MAPAWPTRRRFPRGHRFQAMTTWSRRLIRGNPGGALKRAGRLGAAAVLFGLVAGAAGAQTIGDARGAAASIVDELLPLASLPHSSAWQVDPNFHAREISGKDFLSAASDCGSHPGVSRKMVRAAASVDYYRQFKHGSLGFFDAVGKFDDKAHARKFIADMRPN